MREHDALLPEMWAGLAAMLVVLPSSIAFGALVFSPLGADFAAAGAVAGLIGAIVIGVVAPLFGGTNRLISGPSAPAAAVLSALALQLSHLPILPQHAVFLLSACSLAAGAAQFFYGLIGGGRLIKYIPYSVSAGFLAGVGLFILLSQLPNLLGFPPGVGLAEGILYPGFWSATSLVVGAVTVGLILAGPRLTKSVPAALLGVAGGTAVYFALGFFDRSLWTLTNNTLVIGPIRGAEAGFFREALGRWSSLGALSWGDLRLLAGPTLTLSVLLSFDTLKTCVIVDDFSVVRHRSNKELVGQGLANIASALGGGLSGSGQVGATMVNIGSGARTRLSSVLEGLLCLAVFVVLGRLLAWVPHAALAGVLTVVAARMIDPRILSLLKDRSTVFDFFVVAAVMAAAAGGSLIAAAAVGLGLAILLFIREQMRTSIVRRMSNGGRSFSKQSRLPAERRTLEALGVRTVVCELQGNLFFGTADQLYTRLEEDLASCRCLILNMRRVHAVDVTARHVLSQIGARLLDHGGSLLLSDLPRTLPGGRELAEYFGRREGTRVFAEMDDALAWAENRILEEEGAFSRESAPPLALEDVPLLRGLDAQPRALLRSCLEERRCAKGDAIFRHGDEGDELFFIRRGRVRIELPVPAARRHHLATFVRGDFFGEIAFLDGGRRTADAAADSDAELFVLSRRRFEEKARAHPDASAELFSRLASVLALRLRRTDAELSALQED